MTEFSSQHGYPVAKALRGTKLLLAGRTYGNRDWIKSVNGTWDEANKQWSVPIPGSTKNCADLLYEIVKRGMQWQAV